MTRKRLRHARHLRAPLVAYRHRGVSQHDVFLASYPRSGSTWLRMMFAYLLLGDEPEFDKMPTILPRVGTHRSVPSHLPGGGRLIKTHERRQFPYAHKCRRRVYLVRDGRDVAVSYYHWLQRREGYAGDFSEFLPAFLKGRTDGYGTWESHVRSWVGEGDTTPRDTLLIRYEDMLADPEPILAEVAAYVGLDPDPARVRDAVARQRIESMQKRAQQSSRLKELATRPDVPYIRRGRSGEWADVFDEADTELFERSAGATLRRLGYSTGARS